MGLIVPPHIGQGLSQGVAFDTPDGAGGGGTPPDPRLFGEINNELADKGFLVTSTDELITWARTGSLMWMTFGLACCAVEMMQSSMPRLMSSGKTRSMTEETSRIAIAITTRRV